jgi:ABC-type nickel/cobalt efflux system permease component RcnA
MLLADFIIMIIGALILYVAQNIKNNPAKWILRIVGIILLLFPALILLWNNVIAGYFRSNEPPAQQNILNILKDIEP